LVDIALRQGWPIKDGIALIRPWNAAWTQRIEEMNMRIDDGHWLRLGACQPWIGLRSNAHCHKLYCVATIQSNFPSGLV
jgi:hypothetical protein